MCQWGSQGTCGNISTVVQFAHQHFAQGGLYKGDEGDDLITLRLMRVLCVGVILFTVFMQGDVAPVPYFVGSRR
jgi:hypothetical protein